jgi:hypothetical protein
MTCNNTATKRTGASCGLVDLGVINPAQLNRRTRVLQISREGWTLSLEDGVVYAAVQRFALGHLMLFDSFNASLTIVRHVSSIVSSSPSHGSLLAPASIPFALCNWHVKPSSCCPKSKGSPMTPSFILLGLACFTRKL